MNKLLGSFLIVSLTFTVMSCKDGISGNSEDIQGVPETPPSGTFDPTTTPIVYSPALIVDPLIVTTEASTHQTVTIEKAVNWPKLAAVQASFHVAGFSKTNNTKNSIRVTLYSGDAATSSYAEESSFDLSTASNNFDAASSSDYIYLVGKLNLPSPTNIAKISIAVTSGDDQFMVSDAVITPAATRYSTEELAATGDDGILLLMGEPVDPSVFGSGGITGAGQVDYRLSPSLFAKGPNGLVAVPFEAPVRYQIVSGPPNSSMADGRLTIPLRTGQNQVQVCALTSYRGRVVTGTYSAIIVKNTDPIAQILSSPPSNLVVYGNELPANTVIASIKFVDPDVAYSGQGLSFSITVPSWCRYEPVYANGVLDGVEVITKVPAAISRDNHIYVSVADPFCASTIPLDIGPFTIASPSYTFTRVESASVRWSQHSGGSYPSYDLGYTFKIRVQPNQVGPKMVAWLKDNVIPLTGVMSANRYDELSYRPSLVQETNGSMLITYADEEIIDFYKNSNSGVSTLTYNVYFGNAAVWTKGLGLFARLVLRWGTPR